ncbi:response regulator [Picosynechococcus sp. PCC 11901]|uniref:response regulator n=2 Tax=Picosynechococcus sp. PCC 11901 TaxID=2579791 RepID=UPI0010FC0247|nr:response regulator [Picosynechococcus sp. PCC 11901]QCS48498.1 response regulator [Picosynechococcus sp. PCC 11901]
MVGTSTLHNQIILIAEMNERVYKPIATQLTRAGAVVCVSETRQALLEECDRRHPQLLLLGTLPHTNSLDLFRQCRDFWQDLPVVLLAHQPLVNDYFRDWALKQGVRAVLSSYVQHLAQLQATVQDILFPLLEPVAATAKRTMPPTPIPVVTNPAKGTDISRARAIIALNQISEFSQKYFGNLAIGNYWRKAQQTLQSEHPLLDCWVVDHWGSFDPEQGAIASPEPHLSQAELQSLKVWVATFTQECERIVVDFAQLLRQYALSEADCRFLL